MLKKALEVLLEDAIEDGRLGAALRFDVSTLASAIAHRGVASVAPFSRPPAASRADLRE